MNAVLKWFLIGTFLSALFIFVGIGVPVAAGLVAAAFLEHFGFSGWVQFIVAVAAGATVMGGLVAAAVGPM